MTHEQISNIKTAAISAGVGGGTTFAIDWNHIAERGVETGILALINTAVAVIAGLSIRWAWKKFIKD
jgi:hypothetical protein